MGFLLNYANLGPNTPILDDDHLPPGGAGAKLRAMTPNFYFTMSKRVDLAMILDSFRKIYNTVIF